MTTERIDRILLGLGALLILISSYQLFFSTIENSVGPKLGTLTSTLSVVKTKNALALDWRDASSGNDLTENQLIYTDNKSSAEIVFTEGNSLQIGENSLIKLRTAGKEQSMDLSKGFIRAKLQGDKPLKVQMNGEDYVVSGNNADIQINIQDEKGEIGVITGNVSVEGGGIKENLSPENALSIDGDKVTKKKIYFKAVLPEKNSIRYVVTSPAQIEFSWLPQEDAKIVISDKVSLVRPITLSGTSEALLSPGLYYYKLESEKGSSLISSFRIIHEEAPEILRPKNGDEVEVVEGQNSQILLQWKADDRIGYLLEWNDGEIKSKKVIGGSSLIRIGNIPSFEWRVRIDDEKRPDALWSPWQKSQITYITLPAVPTDLAPHEVEYQTYEEPNEKIELTWSGSSSVDMEIKYPDGKVDTQQIKEQQYTLFAKSGGLYAWRVRSFDKFARKSEWSDWKTFRIEDLSKDIAENKIQKIQLKKPDQSVTFNWKAEAGTTSVFELSSDAQFKTIIKRSESTKNSAQINIPVTGTYYWRSRQYLPDGTFNVSEPKRVIIEPVPAPDKPERLPDLEIPLQDLPQKSSFLKTILHFILPSAYADDTKGMVTIDLPSREEAKAYIVRIYRDQDLTDLVFEKEITTKKFEWRNAKAGVFYWQYAVVDFWDRKSLFSDPAVLTIKQESIPLADKPRLLSPIRASEITEKDLKFRFTNSDNATLYRVEISDTKKFNKLLHKKESKNSEVSFTELKLSPGLYYWRVFALNKKAAETISNTGRFTITSPRERIVIADFPPPFQKEWKSRGFIAWAPSMDDYSFSDGESGKISGTALMSGSISGTMFKDNYAFNGELLRQTGKVFEKESYLFQRLLVDGLRVIDRNTNHKIGVGIALGQTSSQVYTIDDSVVTSKAVSGLSYGPVVKNYFAINRDWEGQGRVMYLLGEVKQIEIGGDAIRHWRSYLLSFGLGYASREYEVSSGKQSSLKLSLGFGKEF